MLTRAAALAIALITGAVGVFPSVGWHRCLWMAERMPPAHECCPEHQSSAPGSIAAPCCEVVAAVAKQVRATSVAPDQGLSPPILVGLVSFSSPDVGASQLSAKAVAAYPQEQPPGDLLHAFSPVLRV
jgi:hypothetical protein